MDAHLTLSRDLDGGAVVVELDGAPAAVVDPARLLALLVPLLELDDVADAARNLAGGR